MIFGISMVAGAGPMYYQHPIFAQLMAGAGLVLVCLTSIIGGMLMIPYSSIETIVAMCDGILT